MRINSILTTIPAALLLLTAAPAQDRRGPDAAAEAASVPKDGHLRRHDPNDARIPPEALFAPRAAAAATGDYRIDSLLSGYKWSQSTITYSFYEDDVFHGSYNGSETGVREVSEAVKTNVRRIMAWYATAMNLDLVEVTETSSNIGLIRFMFSNGPNYAYAYYPYGTAMFSQAGDVHLNPSYDQATDTNGSVKSGGAAAANATVVCSMLKPGNYTVTAQATLGSQTASSAPPHAFFSVGAP